MPCRIRVLLPLESTQAALRRCRRAAVRSRERGVRFARELLDRSDARLDTVDRGAQRSLQWREQPLPFCGTLAEEALVDIVGELFTCSRSSLSEDERRGREAREAGVKGLVHNRRARHLFFGW